MSACELPAKSLFTYYLRENFRAILKRSRLRVCAPPKTYRVKPVPEDLIEAAKDFSNGEGQPHRVALAMEWLANPENWEADDE